MPSNGIAVWRERGKKSYQQHPVFPGGHPSKYWLGSMLLNFSDRTRTGVLNMIWPLVTDTRKMCLDQPLWFWLESWKKVTNGIAAPHHTLQYIRAKMGKKRYQQHPVFPGGHPSKYWLGSMLLNFSVRMRTAVHNMICLLVRDTRKKCLYQPL